LLIQRDGENQPTVSKSYRLATSGKGGRLAFPDLLVMICINWAYLESSAHSFDMQLQKQETSVSLEVAKNLKAISTNFVPN